MKYYVKFNEWQEMSLKKDVEKIVSILDKNKAVESSVLWEAFLAFLAMALDHADAMCIIPYSRVILTIAAIFPLVLLMVHLWTERNKIERVMKHLQGRKETLWMILTIRSTTG